MTLRLEGEPSYHQAILAGVDVVVVVVFLFSLIACALTIKCRWSGTRSQSVISRGLYQSTHYRLPAKNQSGRHKGHSLIPPQDAFALLQGHSFECGLTSSTRLFSLLNLGASAGAAQPSFEAHRSRSSSRSSHVFFSDGEYLFQFQSQQQPFFGRVTRPMMKTVR